MLTICRVKLPKSFLAVNLSENHSFHKKENQSATDDPQQSGDQSALPRATVHLPEESTLSSAATSTALVGSESVTPEIQNPEAEGVVDAIRYATAVVDYADPAMQ